MLQRLFDRNEGFRRLRDEGYDVSLSASNNHVLVAHVPYVTSRREVTYGTLVCVLSLNGEIVNAPPDHVIHFIGEHPCDADGVEIVAIRHSATRQEVDSGLVVDRSFSARPDVPFASYYAKIKNYAHLIGGPARQIDPDATAATWPPYQLNKDESVFVYADTSSSRAGISALAAKFEDLRVGIVGVGGTGSYVLDLVAKTSVRKIHLFDSDIFSSHNAFRAPGAASLQDLETSPKKAEYFAGIYSRMRRGISTHPNAGDDTTIALLARLDFVFLCLDKTADKAALVRSLLAARVPFIDVGMGLELGDGFLVGVLRTTTSSAEKCDHVLTSIPLADADEPDVYGSNIQVAEMNALNAALAVIKWKKLVGYYRDLEGEHLTYYSIGHNTLLNQYPR